MRARPSLLLRAASPEAEAAAGGTPGSPPQVSDVSEGSSDGEEWQAFLKSCHVFGGSSIQQLRRRQRSLRVVVTTEALARQANLL